MKKGINKSCYIKCLASIYGIVMLMILFGRPSYDTWEPYWEQVKMNINLMPFRTISQYLYLLIKRRNEHLIFHAFINLFGNIVAFIPMGIFLSCLSRTEHKFLHSILWSTLIIIGIEFIQLFTLSGTCDIDDLFLNLFGVMLGNLALHIYGKVHKSEFSKESHVFFVVYIYYRRNGFRTVPVSVYMRLENRYNRDVLVNIRLRLRQYRFWDELAKGKKQDKFCDNMKNCALP